MENAKEPEERAIVLPAAFQDWSHWLFSVTVKDVFNRKSF